MNKEVYDECLATGELQLTRRGYWTHFCFVFFLGFIALAMISPLLIDVLTGRPFVLPTVLILAIMVPFALAPLSYWMLKRKLRFLTVKTTLDQQELKNVLTHVSRRLKWKFVSKSEYAYVAKTSPGFFSGSWGEQITILIDKNNVHVNSICDPDKHPSLVSFGRNRENEQTLMDAITEAENKINIPEGRP